MAVDPTVSQRQIRDQPALDLRIIAPAGCGKTEALALRIVGLIDRGAVAPPRKILALTFSKRARDNIRERLQSYLSPGQLRRLVTVINFHGLSGRLIEAHGNVIGLDPAFELPTSDWVGAQCRTRKLSFAHSRFVETTLRETKQESRDDTAVADALSLAGDTVAIDIEKLRVAERRLTYDDLPRLAELILSNDAVAELYRQHFACIVVDEFQDLTLQQLRIVNAIGYGRTTYAGDLAQCIYSFAGAQPEEVLRRIEDETKHEVSFAQSHRSSPAVIDMVNALAPLTNGQRLTCAAPERWPGGGLAGVLGFDSTAAEASWAVEFSRTVIERAPRHRIGIIARTKARRRFVDDQLADGELPHYRWDDPVLDGDAARILARTLAGLSESECRTSADLPQLLAERSGIEEVQDSETRTSLTDAIGWACDQLREDVDLDAIRSRVRTGTETTLLTAAGAHLLSGHVGKGQQFDWVLVLGAEDGCIPDFRAESPSQLAEETRILGVMMSRARHGIVISHAAVVEASNGRPWHKDPSPFIRDLQKTARHHTTGEIRTWLDAADWTQLAMW